MALSDDQILRGLIRGGVRRDVAAAILDKLGGGIRGDYVGGSWDSLAIPSSGTLLVPLDPTWNSTLLGLATGGVTADDEGLLVVPSNSQLLFVFQFWVSVPASVAAGTKIRLSAGLMQRMGDFELTGRGTDHDVLLPVTFSQAYAESPGGIPLRIGFPTPADAVAGLTLEEVDIVVYRFA